MNVLFWIIAIIMTMCLVFAFISSVFNNDIEQRRTDVMVGSVILVMLLLLIKVFFGGCYI